MKRDFLMLAHTYTGTEHVSMWYMSEKLDGLRVYFDGGITRGKLCSEVPFANTEKDSRYVTQPRATGLWSRYGKAIQAPDWWLDRLPNFPLDGELYSGRGSFQTIVSTVKRLQPGPEWKAIRLMTFDSPPYHAIFANGEINNTNFRKKFVNVLSAFGSLPDTKPPRWDFHTVYEWLSSQPQNDVFNVHKQVQLYGNAKERIAEELDYVVSEGGEGLMLRAPTSLWAPQRTRTLLKVKALLDAEAIVKGYVWGRETDKGSKLLGLMGALIVEWQGKRFELSGFTDSERVLVDHAGRDATALGCENPGGLVVGAESRLFPVGSMVTFKYRELTDAGIPKEARYFRKRDMY